MKLALGTVQFGIPYGINNMAGVPDDDGVRNILNLAAKSNISILDTASTYGNCEERIGKLGNGQFNIVTKFSNVINQAQLNSSLVDSLNKLQRSSLYAYISHHSEDLIRYPELWTFLQEQKYVGKIQKIGYSLYTIDQFNKLLDLGLIPDIVQIPFNLLDRRFDFFFDYFIENNIEVHARSIFLQGLFFVDTESLAPNLAPLKPALTTLHKCAEEFGITITSLALNFAIHNPAISQVLVGIETEKQLADNLNRSMESIAYQDICERVAEVSVSHPELLIPSNW